MDYKWHERYQRLRKFLNPRIVFPKDYHKSNPPLPLAIEKGEVNLALALIEKNVNIEAVGKEGFVNAKGDKNPRGTPFQISVRRGHYDVFVALLERGGKIHERDEYSFTPLHDACKHGHESIAMELVNRGADINVRTKQLFSPLIIAIQHNQLHVAKALVERGCDIHCKDIYSNTPLHTAAECGYTDFCMYLYSKGAPMNAMNRPSQQTPLYNAIKANKFDLAVKLMTFTDANIHLVHFEDDTALHYGVHKGSRELCQAILRTDFDVNVDNSHSQTALCVAFKKKELLIASDLIRGGADVTLDHDIPMVHLAIENNVIELFRTLMTQTPIDPIYHSKRPESTLYLAVKVSNAEMVEVLCSRGAEVNDDRYVEYTLLQQAIELSAGQDTLVPQLLIKYGATVNVHDKWGNTPLHTAAKYGQLELAQSLVYGHSAQLDAKGYDEDTPLHVAVDNGHLGVAKVLIDAGAKVYFTHEPDDVSIDAVREANETARDEEFLNIIRNKDTVTLKKFLDVHRLKFTRVDELGMRRFSVDSAIDDDGKTGLMLATLLGDRGIVRILVENGADILYTNKFGESAVSIAESCGFGYILKFFQEVLGKHPSIVAEKQALLENELFPPKREMDRIVDEEVKGEELSNEHEQKYMKQKAGVVNDEDSVRIINGLSSSLEQAASSTYESLAFLAFGRTLLFLHSQRRISHTKVLSNILKLGERKVCTHSVMLFTRHMFSPVTLTVIVDVLCYLSEHVENLERFQRTGLADSSLVALNLYIDTPHLVKNICKIIASLCKLKSTLIQLCDGHVNEILKHALGMYHDTDNARGDQIEVLKEILLAILGTCNLDENRNKYARIGGIALILCRSLEKRYNVRSNAEIVDLHLSCIRALMYKHKDNILQFAMTDLSFVLTGTENFWNACCDSAPASHASRICLKSKELQRVLKANPVSASENSRKLTGMAGTCTHVGTYFGICTLKGNPWECAWDEI